MKKILFILSFFIATLSFGQTAAPLATGKQITIITTTSQDIDMGMQMTTSSTTNHKINLVGADDKNYTFSNTLTKFLFKGNMMGKETTFDSDKPEDRNSEEGKPFASMLDKTDTIAVSRQTGKAINDKEEKADAVTEDDNPIQGMMSGMAAGNSGALTSGILFRLPVAAAKGNTWTDSSTENGMKSTIKYIVDNIADGIATIGTSGTMNGSSTMELQGNSFDMTMDTKSTGTILVDLKSGLVKKRNNIADVDGSLEIMGQSMPFKSKTTTESVYQ